MRSYLSLIPISAKVRKRQNRMMILCIMISVLLVTAFAQEESSTEQKKEEISSIHWRNVDIFKM